MRIFVQKPRASQQTRPAHGAEDNQTSPGRCDDAHSILQLQRATGNHAVEQLLEAGAPTQDIHQLAHDGTTDEAGPLPHLDQIQQSFGSRHDLRRVRAHVGRRAAESARRIGAEAYTFGEQVAFGVVPGLRTAAHEAAHVVQQRRGVQLDNGVGEPGDPYERHADAVADMVVRGGSAEPLLNRIPAASVGHAERPQVQRSPDLDGRTMMREVERAASALVEQYRNDPEGLARRIIADLSAQGNALDDFYRHQPAYRALTDFPDQAGLATAIVRQLPDDRARQLATRRPGVLKALATTALHGGMGAEAERIMSIVVNPAHAHLFGETASQSAAVRGALTTHGARLQSIASGTGPAVFDEYWIIMNAMPPNLTAEEYLTEMSQDLNAAVRSEAFDDINVFSRTRKDQRRGAAAVGDVYDIDIQGPDNGSVMLVERTPSHFVFQTVATTQTGAHPEFGSREFGFEVLEKGAVRWYTRGASRAGSDLVAMVGGPVQKRGWTAMLMGIGSTLQSRGGSLRPGSFGHGIRRL